MQPQDNSILWKPDSKFIDIIGTLRSDAWKSVRSELINEFAQELLQSSEWAKSDPILGLRVIRLMEESELSFQILHVIEENFLNWKISPEQWIAIFKDQLKNPSDLFLSFLQREVKRNPSLLEDLKHAGWDINHNYTSAGSLLQYCCEYWKEENDVLIISLVKAGAELNPLHNDSPLFKLCRNINDTNLPSLLHLARFLLHHGADPNRIEPAAHLAIMHLLPTGKSGIALIDLLIEHHASVTLPDPYNRVPLHFAVLSEDPSTVSYLIEKGADANALDSEGLSPADYAIQKERVKNHTSLVECLEILAGKDLRISEISSNFKTNQFLTAVQPGAYYFAESIQRWIDWIGSKSSDKTSFLACAANTWSLIDFDDSNSIYDICFLLNLDLNEVQSMIQTLPLAAHRNLCHHIPYQKARLITFLQALLILGYEKELPEVLSQLPINEDFLGFANYTKDLSEKLACEIIKAYPELCEKIALESIESYDLIVLGPLNSLQVLAALGNERLISIDCQSEDYCDYYQTSTSPLDIACKQGHPTLAKTLLDTHFPQINIDDMVSLSPHLALHLLENNQIASNPLLEKLQNFKKACKEQNSQVQAVEEMIDTLSLMEDVSGRLIDACMTFVILELQNRNSHVLGQLEEKIADFLSSICRKVTWNPSLIIAQYLYVCGSTLKGSRLLQVLIDFNLALPNIGENEKQLFSMTLNFVPVWHLSQFLNEHQHATYFHKLIEKGFVEACLFLIRNSSNPATFALSSDDVGRFPFEYIDPMHPKAGLFILESLKHIPKHYWNRKPRFNVEVEGLQLLPLTLLDYAALTGWKNVFNFLVINGNPADWHKGEDQWNVLHTLAYCDNHKLLAHFIINARKTCQMNGINYEQFIQKLLSSKCVKFGTPLSVAMSHYYASVVEMFISILKKNPDHLVDILRTPISSSSPDRTLALYLFSLPIFDTAASYTTDLVHHFFDDMKAYTRRAMSKGQPKTAIKIIQTIEDSSCLITLEDREQIADSPIAQFFREYPQLACQQPKLVSALQSLSPTEFITFIESCSTPALLMDAASEQQKSLLPEQTRHLAQYVPNLKFLYEPEDNESVPENTLPQLLENFRNFNFIDPAKEDYVDLSEIEVRGFKSNPDNVIFRINHLMKELDNADPRQAQSFIGSCSELKENYTRCKKLICEISQQIQQLKTPLEQSLWLAQLADAAGFCQTGIVSRLFTIYGNLSGQIIDEDAAYETTIKKTLQRLLMGNIQSFTAKYTPQGLTVEGLETHVFQYFLWCLLKIIPIPKSDMISNRDRFLSLELVVNYPPERVQALFLSEYFGTKQIVEHFSSEERNGYLSGTSLAGETREIAYETPPAWLELGFDYEDLYELNEFEDPIGIKPDVFAHVLWLKKCLMLIQEPEGADNSQKRTATQSDSSQKRPRSEEQ